MQRIIRSETAIEINRIKGGKSMHGMCELKAVVFKEETHGNSEHRCCNCVCNDKIEDVSFLLFAFARFTNHCCKISKVQQKKTDKKE